MALSIFRVDFFVALSETEAFPVILMKAYIKHTRQCRKVLWVIGFSVAAQSVSVCQMKAAQVPVVMLPQQGWKMRHPGNEVDFEYFPAVLHAS